MAKKTKTMDEEAAKGLGSEKALTMEEEVSIISSFRFHQLPSEIFFDILSRLSIESLVILKTVSKWWNNTLENQKLAHQLISVSLKDSGRNGILTMSYDDDDNSSSLKFSNNGERPKVIHHAPLELKDPNKFKFVNCCNGLICFVKKFEGMDQIFICNPVTKEVISLPSTEKPKHSSFGATYGLGFSPATEEYKVIGLVIDLCMKPKIFTLGTSSSWRNIASAPIYPFYGKSIYANGALHWKLDPLMTVSCCTDDNIMSFDIEKEEFYIMKDPKLGTAMCERMDLIQVGGCLGVVNRSFHDHIDIWLLKDNIKKQWVKEYVLKVQHPPSYLESRRDNVSFRIIGLWKQGEIFIAWNNDYQNTYDPFNWGGYSCFSYDPKTDERRDIHSIIEPNPSTVITKVVCGYTMSLVSLKPYGYKKRPDVLSLMKTEVKVVRVEGTIVLHQIFICNPVTKEVISLPSANGVKQHPFFVDYGFGFSPATEEYKVVRRFIILDKKPKVFTLGTSSSWRTIASDPIHPSYGKNIYANGALHWKTNTIDNIISFDIENEEFYLTKVPKLDSPMCEQKRVCERMDLIQVRGCLGVVIKSYISEHLDIRVLKDKEWINEYVLKVQLPSYLETSIRGSVAFRIIGLWQHGEIFIAWKKHYYGFCDPSNWGGYNFFSYDPKTDRRRDIRRIVEPKPPSTTITKIVCGYTMSLVSLKPYGYKKQ